VGLGTGGGKSLVLADQRDCGVCGLWVLWSRRGLGRELVKENVGYWLSDGD